MALAGDLGGQVGPAIGGTGVWAFDSDELVDGERRDGELLANHGGSELFESRFEPVAVGKVVSWSLIEQVRPLPCRSFPFTGGEPAERGSHPFRPVNLGFDVAGVAV